jgi:Spy/CpxP family protein refolding chaperone
MSWRALLISAFTLLPLAAQTPRSRPPVAWWENPVANGLTLSEDQKHRINHIVREHRDQLATDRQEVERAERDLESVFNADVVDFQRGRLVTEQLVKARGQLTQDMVRMTLRLRGVLTTDQWKSLQDRNASDRVLKGERGREAPAKSGKHIH